VQPAKRAFVWGHPCLAVIVLAAAVAPSGAARAQTATVDQVLTAIAEVVRDRAKRVASRALARRVSQQLCTGSVDLKTLRAERSGSSAPIPLSPPTPGRESESVATAPTPAITPTLALGGGPECRASRDKCTADDVFVRSCALLRVLEVPLTDAYFLKTLSRDAVEFAVRLGGANLDRDEYRRVGLGAVAEYVFAVLDRIAEQGPSLGSIAEPTLRLADQLETDLPANTLEFLARSKTTPPLASAAAQVARKWITAGCPYREGNASRKACANTADPAIWFVEPPGSCGAYRDHRDERRAVYRQIFQSSPGRTAAPGSREDPCSDVADEQCRSAQVTLNLHDLLSKIRCQAEMAPEEKRSTLRELGYVLAERQSYRTSVPAAALDAFVAELDDVQLGELPRQELAYGVRVAGAYFAALRDDRQATQDWLLKLGADLRKAVNDTSMYDLLHGPALGTKGPIPPVVADLRNAVKDFLTLPLFQIQIKGKLAQPALRGQEIARFVLRQIVELKEPGHSTAEVVQTLAVFIQGLAQVTAERSEEIRRLSPSADRLSAPLPPESVASRAALPRVTDALVEAAKALRLASQRDWVGLAVEMGEQLELRAGGDGAKAMLPTIRFIRVLFSMYQAANVEEAKAIFASALEDESSREARFGRTAVDVTALLGVRSGFQFAHLTPEGAAPSWDNRVLYGLFVPFGVQVACKSLGVLVYPVDVGSYLVATTNTSSGPKWQDAVRAGITGYYRFSRDVPFVLGIGGDVRPKIDDNVQWRAYLHFSLELPLFSLD
jgi:hypothetical protein